MPRPTILLKRSLIFLHRWVGVLLSIVFMFWFVSGIVMMYWSFPGVSGKDRLERAPVLEAAQIKLSPAEAYATLGRDQAPGSTLLTSYDGRPVYRFGGGGGGGGRRAGGGGGGRRGGGGGGQATVFADDGTQPGPVDDAMFDRVAASWAKLPLSAAKKESMEETDQWTVEGRLRTLRPLYKYSFSDGQQVYVSGEDASVVQYTTSASRFWAYLGAIPHWFYFTTFRVHQPEWFQFIVWSSGIGAVTAILGLAIGIWMYSPAKRYRHANAPTSFPYKGQKRWHTIFGLFFGVIAVTWSFSGLLSMGPFEFVDRITGTGKGSGQTKGAGKGKGGGAPQGINIAGVLRGSGRLDLDAYAAKDPREVLASIAAFAPKEIEFTSFADEPIYMATNGEEKTTIIPIDGVPHSSFEPQRVMSLIREAPGGTELADLRIMDQYDAYYLDRHREKPLPVIYAEVNDAQHTRYYVDPKTARVVGNYNSRGWVNRWLYHGLHSLDFPWLYNYRPLWDIVVISLMLGGTALCVTSLILSWRVIKRKLTGLVPKDFWKNPNDDLPTEVPSTPVTSQSV
ncbi:MAG: PepSY domain-containing protein [Acidobacteriota bacterium]